MRYDHNNLGHRFLLGANIISALEDLKFSETVLDERNREVTMVRLSVCGNYKIVVFTTVNITDRMTRSIGKDAIRVLLLKKKGETEVFSPVSKNKRVFRVGKIEAIKERVVASVRECAMLAKEFKDKSCKSCGGSVFLSKKGNWVCEKFCWTN